MIYNTWTYWQIYLLELIDYSSYPMNWIHLMLVSEINTVELTLVNTCNSTSY